jgi:flagellar biogenesis protein FliO
MSPPLPTPPPKRGRLSPAVLGLGVFVVVLGFIVPQLVSGGAPDAVPDRTPDPAAAALARPGGAADLPAPVVPPSAGEIGLSVLKLVLGLAVVCGACAFLARRVAPAPPPHAAMEVLASIAVGRCVVHLVRAGERRLLIGTDPAGVKALVELPAAVPDPPSEEVAHAPEPAPPVPAPRTGDEILNLLFRLRGRADAPPPA